MRIKVANYALVDLLKVLEMDDIDEVTITKEDSHIIVIADVQKIRNNNNHIIGYATNE